jgi:hypothetical protein
VKHSKSVNILKSLVPGAGLEPARGYTPRDFKSLASTRSATQAGELWLLAATLYGRMPVPANSGYFPPLDGEGFEQL